MESWRVIILTNAWRLSVLTMQVCTTPNSVKIPRSFSSEHLPIRKRKFGNWIVECCYLRDSTHKQSPTQYCIRISMWRGIFNFQSSSWLTFYHAIAKSAIILYPFRSRRRKIVLSRTRTPTIAVWASSTIAISLTSTSTLRAVVSSAAITGGIPSIITIYRTIATTRWSHITSFPSRRRSGTRSLVSISACGGSHGLVIVAIAVT